MIVLDNIGELATCKASGPQHEVHCLSHASVVIKDDRIEWIGKDTDLPVIYKNYKFIDCKGKLLIPGLVDCHTHLAFAGWRFEELKDRILGDTYLDSRRKGGGIISTVKHTREASLEELALRLLVFLREILLCGVTTLEAKSGYGLSLEHEIKILEVYKTLNDIQPITIVPTFLGAHTVPQELSKSRSKYIELIIKKMIPEVSSKKLAEFCDVFIEKGAFTPDEGEKILKAAKKANLKLKIHADQLTNLRSAELAAKLGAISADHLEKISPAGIEALSKSKTVAVLLPFAGLYTFSKPTDGRKLIDEGVSIAVATDFNPGTAPSFDLPLAMSLSCLLNRIIPTEALKGATIIAAKAIGREKEIGSIEIGKKADMVLIEAETIDQWLLHIKRNQCLFVMKGGEILHKMQ